MRRYGCEAADQLGQIDILVNNAAVQRLIEPVWGKRSLIPTLRRTAAMV